MPEPRPTTADIDLGAFARNLAVAERLAGPGVRVMAVLKADAYGHGALPLARVAEKAGCPVIGVATTAEGLLLRRAGISIEILVLAGITRGTEDEALAGGLSGIVYDHSSAQRLARCAAGKGQRFPVHLKVDTGMGRFGFLPGEIGKAARRLASMKGLEVTGVMTHYARADEPEAAATSRQEELFEECLQAVSAAGLQPRWIHAANSAALLLHRGCRGNLVRAGIMLYGSVPPGLAGGAAGWGLEPVMTFRTAVIQLKRVPEGWPVSYGGHWVAPGPRLIGIIAAGYADGFLRYNGRGEVLIRGRRAPIVGDVCMDITMVDVTGIDGVSEGDEVVLIGRQGDDAVTAEEVAKRGGTISYEVFCGLGARVTRRHMGP